MEILGGAAVIRGIPLVREDAMQPRRLPPRACKVVSKVDIQVQVEVDLQGLQVECQVEGDLQGLQVEVDLQVECQVECQVDLLVMPRGRFIWI